MDGKHGWLFFSGVSADAGDGFRGDANIRRDHVLGYAVGDGRESVEKMLVFFFSGITDAGRNAVLGHDETALQNGIYQIIQLRDIFA